MLITHGISAISAIFISLRYAHALRIRKSEMSRYLHKSFNLALCYTGFMSKQNLFQASRAGEAAFFSSAYDVITDWRGFRDRDISAIQEILHRTVSKELYKMAVELLERDRLGILNYDGLERGITSVQFITSLMGSERHFEQITDINRLGVALQIVDDVLDYEADVSVGDTNCLCSAKRAEYLTLLAETLSEQETARLFPYGTVMRYVIKRGVQKAQELASSNEQANVIGIVENVA